MALANQAASSLGCNATAFMMGYGVRSAARVKIPVAAGADQSMLSNYCGPAN